jgi:RNA polymerase sigma factor (sigma-70 family)
MRRTEDREPPLEHLLEEHLPSLRTYVRRNMDAALAGRESCADLVQSVCREVLQSRGAYRYQGDAAFRQWLFQVALHKLMDRRRFYRAGKRAEEGGVREKLAWSRDELARLAESVGTPSADAMLREELDSLSNALERLTESDQDIVRWVHLEHLSHSAVAERLGCTEPQSRKRLFQALTRLSLYLRRARA